MTKFNIGNTVRIISTDGDYRAAGRGGQEAIVTNVTDGDKHFPPLVAVRCADGTEFAMFDYRFEPVKKPRKTKPKATNTKIAKVRAHFISGRSLTQLEAIGLYGAFRLAARVHELKAEGMKIVTRMKEDPNGNPYAEYQLRSPWVKG